MKKDELGICRFEKIKEVMTVGDIFELHCEWPVTVILSAPVRIEFKSQKKQNQQKGDTSILKSAERVQPENSYSLFVLDTISILPGRGIFKVTSYKPGNYKAGFKLVSDQGELEVQPVSWHVESVIPEGKKETIQAYPPYGPWVEPLPFWYWPFSVLTLLGFIVFVSVKIYTFVNRKKKIQEITDRLKNKNPFREFISQLNLLVREINNKEGKEIIKKAEKDFRLFLENEFFIFALDKEPKKIVKQLKKYYPGFSEEQGILNFFTEVSKLSSEKIKREDSEQILGMAREVAIACLEKKEGR